MSSTVKYAAAAVVIVIIAALIVISYTGVKSVKSASGVGTTSLAFQLTDPPFVPLGTQALVVDYSSIKVHEIGSNGTATWVNSSQSGSVDLMSLVNLTQTIAELQVSTNSVINQAEFNITSASITVNGTTYPVSVPEPLITANVTGSTSINSTATPSIIVDMSPTVLSIYTSNSTLFVMVPSVRAVIVPGINHGVIRVGAKANLTATDRDYLGRVRPNITITNAQLSENNNYTTISVTVKDNSNASATLQNMLLFGIPSVRVFPYANATASSNSTIGVQPQAPVMSVGVNSTLSTYNNRGYASNGSQSSAGGYNHLSVVINGGVVNVSSNGSLETSTRVEQSASSEAEINQGLFIERFRVLNFRILSNGTLALPFEGGIGRSGRCINPVAATSANASVGGGAASANSSTYVNISIYCLPYNQSGYTLQPGQSVTLTFNGIISFGGECSYPIRPVPLEASPQLVHLPISVYCPITAGVVPGSTYRIVVIGERGAHATANVTAE